MPHEPQIGRVALVGAGPGPADLLTIRALRAIEDAEALLYDALVGREILDLAPPGCIRIQTGKRAGRASMKQDTINRLMLRLARRGLRVVRLKGGDPSVFGRVGEESAFLRDHAVPVEIVPGITAACAAAAQFDFPLTHRALARRVVFTTATLEPGAPPTDWRFAADQQTTLAIYMGGAAGHALSRRLIALGRSPATPVLAVENAAGADARLTVGRLDGLGELAAAKAGGPVLIVVGDVAALAARRDTPVNPEAERPAMSQDHARLFQFESDFVATLRCIPMAVRLKLDTCGVKLTLRQWSRFTREDRQALLLTPCASPEEIDAYHSALEALVRGRAGEAVKPLPPTPLDQWEDQGTPATVVTAYARSLGLTPPTRLQWSRLTPLQRFTLIKLTRDNHDNVNFAPAMAEFGLGVFAQVSAA
jgi:uroporphyrin-III C-methyltransferase